MKDTIKVYRFEHPTRGLWYNKDANFEPFVAELKNSLAASIPIEFNTRYRDGGLKWFSSAKSKEDISHWFSTSDANALDKAGFQLYEIEVSQYRVEPFEIMFTREGVLNKKRIPIQKLWKELA